MKNLTLQQGAEALIILADGHIVNSIPYASVTQMSMEQPPLFKGSEVLSDYITIISDNKEIKIDFDRVLSPVVVDAAALLDTLIGWVYSYAAPTTAATTTAATTTEPLPDYTYTLYWLDQQTAPTEDNIWLSSSHGDVTAVMNSATYFKIIGTASNDMTIQASSLGTWILESSRTKATGLSILNATELGVGQIEVYI